MSYLPAKMDIENVSRCNFRCTMCQVSDWAGGKRARDMTLEEFQGFLSKQVGITEIKLQGLGEPLLGPDFFEMIRFARSRHIWVRVTTNSSLLHHKENYRHLVDSDVCEVQMSLDGATPEVFEAFIKSGFHLVHTDDHVTVFVPRTLLEGKKSRLLPDGQIKPLVQTGRTTMLPGNSLSQRITDNRGGRKAQLSVRLPQVEEFYRSLLGADDLRTADEKFLDHIGRNYH